MVGVFEPIAWGVSKKGVTPAREGGSGLLRVTLRRVRAHGLQPIKRSRL